MRLFAAAAAVLALLAGCATGPGDADGPVVLEAVESPDWAVRAIYGDNDSAGPGAAPEHDHADRDYHRGLSSANVEVLGHVSFGSQYLRDQPAGQSWCADVARPGARQISVVHSFDTDVALTVLDVTDRTAPLLLGELVLPFVWTYDVGIFEDGRYAVLAGNPDLTVDMQPGATAAGIPFEGTWRDACGNERPVESTVDYVPYGYSAILVDLTDPTTPVVADFYQYAGGRNVHSISTAMIDTERYIITSGLGALPCTVPGVHGAPPLPVPVPCQPVPRYGNLLSHFDFLTVEETPAGARLVPYGLYTPTDQAHFDPSLLYLANGHTDGTLQKHPVTEQLIAYLADWDGGLHIVRLDGPGQFVPLTTWGAAPGDDPSQMTGNIHSARPLGLRDGKHYTITGQEVVGRPSYRPTGQITLLDTTNPAVPFEVARWTLPIDVQWPPSTGLLYSTHYPIVANDTLYVATYHAGVWAADARPQAWPNLPSIGVFMPYSEEAPAPFKASHTPEVLEVLDLGDGTILTFDGDTGAYIVKFHRGDPRVPPAAPWPMDGQAS